MDPHQKHVGMTDSGFLSSHQGMQSLARGQAEIQISEMIAELNREDFWHLPDGSVGEYFVPKGTSQFIWPLWL